MLHEAQQDGLNYRKKLSKALLPSIDCLVGSELSEIVTGMIIDLPEEDFKLALQDWSALTSQVEKASQLVFEHSLKLATQSNNDWTLFFTHQVNVSYATEKRRKKQNQKPNNP